MRTLILTAAALAFVASANATVINVKHDHAMAAAPMAHHMAHHKMSAKKAEMKAEAPKADAKAAAPMAKHRAVKRHAMAKQAEVKGDKSPIAWVKEHAKLPHPTAESKAANFADVGTGVLPENDTPEYRAAHHIKGNAGHLMVKDTK